MTNLVLARAEYMDLLLNRLWQHFGFKDIHIISLVAVLVMKGELLSDIDILILSNNKLPNALEAKISEFITLLWDLRLKWPRCADECAEIRADLPLQQTYRKRVCCVAVKILSKH